MPCCPCGIQLALEDSRALIPDFSAKSKGMGDVLRTSDVRASLRWGTRDSLAELGIEPGWSFRYNAGANPIAFNRTKTISNAFENYIDLMKLAYELA
jgi:hypothetical protein